MRVERALLAATAAGVVLLAALYLRTAAGGAQLARRNAELDAAARKAEQLRKAAEQERDTLRAAHEALAGTEAAVPAPRREPHTPADAAARLDLIRTLGETQQKLTAANAAIEDLQHSATEFEARAAELTQKARELARSESELKDKLDTQTRLVAALQAELKTRGERLLEVETANVQLRQRRDEAAAQSSPLLEAAAEVEEVSRRREVYVNNVLRRYREVADLYRNLVLRADSPGGDVARIQNAISSADEDLRQIQALNAQSERLQRKLTAARQQTLKR